VPDVIHKWLGKLTRLNPAAGGNRFRGKAPHKPLLLLCILDMAEEGELPGRVLTRTPGLVLRFREYGQIAADRWPTRLDIRKPFHHLSTQGYWKSLTIDMTPAVSPESAFACELDEEFFRLIADADFRTKARLLLISRYFEPVERIALLESLGFAAGRGEQKDPQVMELNEEAEDAARRKGRCARFQVQVVTQYKFTCALTGLCCMTIDGCAVVDSAHIEPWAKSQNDDLKNGLALSRNAHWAFDEGLWSVGNDGRIVVAKQRFTERGPDQLQLSPYGGRFLQFAEGVSLRPGPDSFKRHREFHRL
jgi:putative restriction endonuclease